MRPTDIRVANAENSETDVRHIWDVRRTRRGRACPCPYDSINRILGNRKGCPYNGTIMAGRTVSFGYFRFDFLPGTAYALFADFAYVRIAGFRRFGFLVATKQPTWLRFVCKKHIIRKSIEQHNELEWLNSSY